MILRKLKEVIESQFYNGKAVVLVGARQVGKTTLLNQLAQKNEPSVLWLNCDEPETRALLGETNVAKLQLLIGGAKLVVIDEAQKVNDIGMTLKLIVDNFKEVQVVATGSSAFELHNRLNEPLTGRKLEYRLFPISSAEMIQTYGLLEEKRTLENRLIYGSYPDIVTHPEKARLYLTELTQSYLYKDLFSLVLSCYTNPMKGSRDRPSQYFWHDPDPSSYTPRTISRILGNNRVRKLCQDRPGHYTEL